MKSSIPYPFAALVGQDALKDALLWSAVDPTIGGVLVTGTRGTAKSTAVRALAELLPPVHDENGVAVPTPFVELPIGATEDRVIGTLDVRSLLAAAERRFEPGLLSRAHRGILYVDEVNLLPDHLVDVILDAAATGVNVVERDGASFTHDARIMLVGTMNPEEGELRPQLLDRFGLCVPIVNDEDVERRVQIIEHRIAYELDPPAFARLHEAASAALKARIVKARTLLSHVTVERACLRHAAQLALEAHAEGMRADLTIVRTARAVAAFDGRTIVRIEDIERAAEPALAHRRRQAPRGTPPRPSPPPPNDQPRRTERGRETTQERTFEAGAPTATHLDAFPLARSRRTPPRASRGRGASKLALGVARITQIPGARIAALATIHAAAREVFPLIIDPARHLRFLQRQGRERRLLVFLIDASGSMAAGKRMRAAKGAVCGLLEQAYQRRDDVALIAFRGEQAEVLVPPTRSAALAYRRLQHLPTGGRTPLAAGLRSARALIAAQARRDPAQRTHLIVVSDARANAPEHGALEAALNEAAALRDPALRALWLDTESGRIRLSKAAHVAEALGATYRKLEECSESTLGAAVREWAATA